MQFFFNNFSVNSDIVKPALIVMSEPQSYQLLLVGLAIFGALMFWQSHSK